MLSTPEWPTISIREITLRTSTWNPQTEQRDKIRYIDVSAVSRETLEIDSADEIAAAKAPSRARKIVKSGDTIFATIRPGLKRVAKIPASYDDEIASTAFCVLRPDTSIVDPDFLYFLASSDAFVEEVANFETGASYPAVRDSDILDREIKLPPVPYQRDIASVLRIVRSATLHQSSSLAVAQKLKRAAMATLFTRGLKGEAQKQTDIGLVPESWETPKLEDAADILSTRMTYSTLLSVPEVEESLGRVKVLGIKVADMNRVGPERPIVDAELERAIDVTKIKHFCAPPGTIVFPKNGAAVATNKKRRVDHWSVFDPNVMGLRARPCMSQNYLFQWMQGFDLATIVSPGPVPHFNKSDLARVGVPLPSSADEQKEIVDILDAIDRKIDLHKQKRAVLDQLFKSLLHKLMTGEIRAADLDLSVLGKAPLEEVAA